MGHLNAHESLDDHIPIHGKKVEMAIEELDSLVNQEQALIDKFRADLGLPGPAVAAIRQGPPPTQANAEGPSLAIT